MKIPGKSERLFGWKEEVRDGMGEEGIYLILIPGLYLKDKMN